MENDEITIDGVPLEKYLEDEKAREARAEYNYTVNKQHALPRKGKVKWPEPKIKHGEVNRVSQEEIDEINETDRHGHEKRPEFDNSC